LTIATVLLGALGCQAAKPVRPLSFAPLAHESTSARPNDVRLVVHEQDDPPAPEEVDAVAMGEEAESLELLEAIALANNPSLLRLQNEASALWAKMGYVSKLPDPSLGATFFVPPMRFEPDRQVAEMQVMQMIPWLGRLDAQQQRAHLEALAAENEYQAERLRVVGELRRQWFKLYVLGKQIETAAADKAQLESLITTANARVATGDAQPGDVLMATLELSGIEEQVLSYRQETQSAQAEINRLVGRDAGVPIAAPQTIDAELPDWGHELLRDTALASQPELNAARLRAAAARWGVEIARLQRRPDVTVSGGWIAMDAPGGMRGDGADSWTVGVSTTLPIWHRKYDAIRCEALAEHFAASASVEETTVRLDATLRDLWEQALAAHKTVELYRDTILPQARQAFEADQQSLVNNAVTFDRVIRAHRTLLNLELGYHRALGQLATALARIRQTMGVDEPFVLDAH
jgi:outer membrane protein TolC